VLDPPELLAVARSLSAATAPPPSKAHLHRAVSTAYYAVFHKVLRAGAERFMGPGMEKSGGYSLIYRAFNHGRMRRVCEALAAGRLSPASQEQLGRTSISQEMRLFANNFVSHHEVRQLADYDPLADLPQHAVLIFVDAAEAAIAAFDQAAPDEQADVLALMLTNPRG
jgi:hypothetical protein